MAITHRKLNRHKWRITALIVCLAAGFGLFHLWVGLPPGLAAAFSVATTIAAIIQSKL